MTLLNWRNRISSTAPFFFVRTVYSLHPKATLVYHLFSEISQLLPIFCINNRSCTTLMRNILRLLSMIALLHLDTTLKCRNVFPFIHISCIYREILSRYPLVTIEKWHCYNATVDMPFYDRRGTNHRTMSSSEARQSKHLMCVLHGCGY